MGFVGKRDSKNLKDFVNTRRRSLRFSEQSRQSQGQQSQGQQSPPPGGGQQTSGQTQPNQPQQQPRQKPSHSDDFDYSPVLPGLELFQTGPDFDPAEEAFARRARKKKKKKGRGL